MSNRNSSPTSYGGMSTGVKAAIGIGSFFGIILLALAACFSARYKYRDRLRPGLLPQGGLPEVGNDTLVESEKEAEESKAQPVPENLTHPAYETNTRLSNAPNMHGLRYHDHKADEEPMYLGVPAHLTGDKRWNAPEYDELSVASTHVGGHGK
jgi:hypothetical protein